MSRSLSPDRQHEVRVMYLDNHNIKKTARQVGIKITVTSIKAGMKSYNQAMRGSNVVDFVRSDDQEKVEGLGDSGRKKEPSEIF